MTGYRFVHDHQAEFDVTRMCELVEVSRSGFYDWRDRPMSDRDVDNAYLANQIHTIFTASRCTYGAPRVLGQLRNNGVRCSRKRVARLMAEHGWIGAHSRRKWRRGKRNPAPAPDLLDRNFAAAASDEKWAADITEFNCVDGKLFLAGIADLHDKTIVGWSMGERQTTDLVVNALVMALARRNPDNVVHHSDHGTQYTSLEFSNRMTAWQLKPSFGSVGDCFDNAKIESIWSVIKREIRITVGPWEELTRSQLRTVLFDYIEVFYNRQRHQAGLGHRTPAETYNRSKQAA